jgi:AcrR family transcriptional regulator
MQMDLPVQSVASIDEVTSRPQPALTAKGAATRERIVRAAADLVLERGAQGTTLDDIRSATTTSKSQLFHYFPEGKSELVSAIGALQAQRVLDAQQPFLDELDSWESWEAWRDAVLVHYRSQPHWGCPIGALTTEMVHSEPQRAPELIAHMERWRAYLTAGISRMIDGGLLDEETDADDLSLAIFALLQGGLGLTATAASIRPLAASLTAALVLLRAHAN